MKNTLALLCLLIISILRINGQAISETDKTALDKFIMQSFFTEKTLLSSDTLDKVFTGKYFNVTTWFNIEGGKSTAGCYDFLLVIKEGTVSEFESVGEDKKLPYLLSLVKKDFSLKTAGDAMSFEACLNKLYPIYHKDQFPAYHKKIGGKWYFVRGEFFDSRMAFILTLDANSRITDIEYKLDAVPK